MIFVHCSKSAHAIGQNRSREFWLPGNNESFECVTVNSKTTGTITAMFSSYDWMKPNLKQKAGTARGKWLVRKDWGKLRGVKSLFLSENMLENVNFCRKTSILKIRSWFSG